MKFPRICIGIGLGLAVLNLASCKNEAPRLEKSSSVSVGDCDPSHDPIKLPKGGVVKWTATDMDYTITFDPKVNPKTSVNITVPGPLHLPKGVETDQTLNLDDDCTPKGCYYKYNITKASETKPCYDPGIHIVPGSGTG